MGECACEGFRVIVWNSGKQGGGACKQNELKGVVFPISMHPPVTFLDALRSPLVNLCQVRHYVKHQICTGVSVGRALCQSIKCMCRSDVSHFRF